MFCQKCGAEVANDATVCMNCGCPTTSAPTPSAQTKQKKPVSKKLIIFSAIGSIVLILAILAALILIRTQVKLDDLTAKPNYVTALFKFGLPRNLSEEQWTYEDCVVFHGTELDYFSVYPEEGEYVIIEFDEDDQEELADILVHYCEYERSFGSYYVFTYENLEITADGSVDGGFYYISIEVWD